MTVRAAALLVLAIGLVGCTVVGEPSAAPSVLPSAVPSVDGTVVATGAPSVSVAPSFAGDTPRPAKTPKPPKSTPSQPSGPALPNLAVSKFITDADHLIVGQNASARVTVANDGSADAGKFNLSISFTGGGDGGGGGGGSLPTVVDGLAAGDSVQVTVKIASFEPGDLTYTATADSGNAIAESNEDDNTATLSLSAVALPNLAWGPAGFSVSRYPGQDGWELDVDVKNDGAADDVDNFAISFAFSSGTASGTFPDLSCCNEYGPPSLAVGGHQTEGVGIFQFPTSGTYTVTATLDSGNKVTESNESDNTFTYQVTTVQ